MILVTSRRAQALISALVMLSLLLIPAAVAKANGAPVRVALAYQPPYSNAGPQDATGRVEIAFDDGEVHGEFEGLLPEEGAQYGLWLYNTKSEEILALTTFQADPSGVTPVDVVFEESIPDEGWDLVVVTIEDDPDASPDPDARWSIVGAFPNAEVESELVPSELPRTGERPGPSDDAPAILVFLFAGALAVGFIAAWTAPHIRREEER
ncbi:MAG TPA: hypothetical protein VKZ96_17135 [Thermomicrobiales bacterium]|nr:hypothetical protein [Thermomicrobiales bacterium]